MSSSKASDALNDVFTNLAVELAQDDVLRALVEAVDRALDVDSPWVLLRGGYVTVLRHR
jgi:hypothetical protein